MCRHTGEAAKFHSSSMCPPGRVCPSFDSRCVVPRSGTRRAPKGTAAATTATARKRRSAARAQRRARKIFLSPASLSYGGLKVSCCARRLQQQLFCGRRGTRKDEALRFEPAFYLCGCSGPWPGIPRSHIAMGGIVALSGAAGVMPSTTPSSECVLPVLLP